MTEYCLYYLRKAFLVALLATSSAMSAQDLKAVNETIDLGKIAYRQPATARFELYNNGDKVLLVDDVRTNCGCTVVDYPKHPVQQGRSFVLSATYDAKQMGHFEKLIAVYVNGMKEPYMLRLKGIVVEHVDKPITTVKEMVAKPAVDKGRNSKKKKIKKRKKNAV
ncbi:MAG: DUF1573 domain-containing protein [Prevotella sp.]|nr:DUF1573 domain-containing protein [Prevotella sp.]